MHQEVTENTRTRGGVRGVWFVFLGFALFAGALACLCYWLELQRREAAVREAELAGQLARQTAQLEQLIGSLEEEQARLSEAERTIGLMEKYSLLTPDGTAPEYTALYPDLYAQPWEGERIDGGRVVCLSFDDGPSPNTDRILAILEQYEVKATFFVVGKTGERDQQRMRDIVAAGHTLAIHSWSHDYKKIYASVEAYLEDFYQLYQWIYEVTGVYPQVFRFP